LAEKRAAASFIEIQPRWPDERVRIDAAKDDLLLASNFTGASGSVIGAGDLVMVGYNACFGLRFRFSVRSAGL
jgi:hypothetical protein